jgi:transposase-like protein
VSTAGSARMAPYHCPYCGEEDLHPREAAPRAEGEPSPGAAWECRSCVRAFAVTYLGAAAGPSSPPITSTDTATGA